MTTTHSENDTEGMTPKFISILTKIFVYSLLAGILFLLKDFFLLVFLTFVFCYIQAAGVRQLEPFVAKRSVRVTIVGILFLALVVAIGALIFPRVQEQARLFVEKFPSYLRRIDTEVFSLRTNYPLFENVFPLPEDIGAVSPNDPAWSARYSPTALFFQNILGLGESHGNGQNVKQALTMLQNVGVKLLGSISSFFLALLFAFLILLDLERLSLSVKSLRNSRLRFIYEEVADGIFEFGRVLGRSLGAQVIIAAVNTILTAFLIVALGLGDKLAFLCSIVFFCSFIPVAGVFFSSVPICLMVLQDAGPGFVVITALAIWVIHLIEAYILNPRIFGRHLRINPVLVLIILTVCGKIFGVWGLVLGVPVFTYVFGHAIRDKTSTDSTVPVALTT